MGLANLSGAKAILLGTAAGFATAGGLETAHSIYGKAAPGAPGAAMPESLMWMHSPTFTGTMGTLTAVASAGLMILGARKVPTQAINGATLIARNENLGRIGMGVMGGSMASMSLAMVGGGHGGSGGSQAAAGGHHGQANASSPAAEGQTKTSTGAQSPMPVTPKSREHSQWPAQARDPEVPRALPLVEYSKPTGGEIWTAETRDDTARPLATPTPASGGAPEHSGSH